MSGPLLFTTEITHKIFLNTEISQDRGTGLGRETLTGFIKITTQATKLYCHRMLVIVVLSSLPQDALALTTIITAWVVICNAETVWHCSPRRYIASLEGNGCLNIQKEIATTLQSLIIRDDRKAIITNVENIT